VDPADEHAQQQRAEIQRLSHFAVASHLEATKRVGAVWLVILLLGAAAYYLLHSWLWLVGALVLCAVAFFAIMQVCVRRVQRSTSLSPRMQAEMSELYKKNSVFRREVDAAIAAAKARVAK
jgi:hypothetical protein